VVIAGVILVFEMIRRHLNLHLHILFDADIVLMLFTLPSVFPGDPFVNGKYNYA
jgi:hypothetical protein